MCTACAVERGQRETRKVVDLLWSVSEPVKRLIRLSCSASVVGARSVALEESMPSLLSPLWQAYLTSVQLAQK